MSDIRKLVVSRRHKRCRRSAHGDDDEVALFGALKPFIAAYTEEEDQGR